MGSDQGDGRKKNAATPAGKPEAAQSDADVRKTGRQARRAAGPDGPDAREVGDTFKRPSSGS